MHKVQYYSLLFLLSFQAATCRGQDFEYKKAPSEYIPKINIAYNTEVSQLKNYAVDLTEYLPSGFVKDGNVDYTERIQKGIDSNEIVLMPDFPILTSGIQLRSGTKLIFQKNSLLKMAPSNKELYQIIAIDKVHDVNVYFARIKGERDLHLGTKGEWGFGIGIFSSKNIRIIGANISDCWGDGIYINNMSSPENKVLLDSNNIFIDGAILDNNRRNGISIIDGKNISIKNTLISNTDGTMPMSGIDIEPNNGYGELKNVTLDSIITFNNKSYGILVSLAFFINKNEKDINLVIKNCTDDGSNYGMGFVFDRPKKEMINAKGSINIINSILKNGRSGEVLLPFYESKNDVILKFQDVKVLEKGKKKAFPLNKRNLRSSQNIIFN